MSKKRQKARIAVIKRSTSETKIEIKLNLDGSGKGSIDTGIPFLDHMLTALSKHGVLDLNLMAKGDLHIDLHHTNEDIGIALGQAFKQALGKKQGIRRYGFFYIPMGDTLVRVVLDFSGRYSFQMKAKEKTRAKIGEYAINDAEHFLESFAQNVGMDLHVDVLSGQDRHHVIEAIFKALARSIDMAKQVDSRQSGVPSTKGAL